MTQPTDRIRELADEISHRKHAESYALGRIRGYVFFGQRGGMSAEDALEAINDVLEAVNLTRMPDPSPAAAAAEVPAELAPRPMTGAEALDAATTPQEWANTAASILGAIAREARDDEDGER